MSQCFTIRTLCFLSPRKSPFSTRTSNDVCSAPSSSAAILAPDLSLARHILSLGYAIRRISGSCSLSTCFQEWTLITCPVPLLPAITIYDNGKRNVPRSGNSKNTCLPLCPCVASPPQSVHHSYSISPHHSCSISHRLRLRIGAPREAWEVSSGCC